jgi:crossover junction endodeoxyribonuclease RuvC
MSLHIGIDPGASGGLAFIPSNGEEPWAMKIPDTHRDLFDVLRDVNRCFNCTAVLEQVHAMPKQGVTSTFTFGEGYGALQMALTAAGIPFTRVTPQKWQKHMQCLTKGDKNVSKARAQELFPHIKVTHAIADALLIAKYAQLTNP